jgi:uncharacterized lipoprotein YehR (DUF1307 family)
MKKLTSLFPLLLMAMMAVAFTSCTDEDEYERHQDKSANHEEIEIHASADHGNGHTDADELKQ